MANWTKNLPAGNNKRRKWNLEDRTSLNNLKYHIASEGCSEVQFGLAKQLLDRTIDENEESSGEQAVYWLMCASQQGHEEAAELLKKCYDDGIGITAENETEVRSCLSMTPGERAARKAARELFACLSNGGKHITPKQLEKKMREIYKMQKRKKSYGSSTSEDESDEEKKVQPSRGHQPLNAGNEPIANGSINLREHRENDKHSSNSNNHVQQRQHRITEENLVSAAVNYAAGRMPAVNDALTLSIPHPASLDHVPCFHRLLLHPIIFLTLLYHRLINIISCLPKSIPQRASITLLLIAYMLIYSDNLLIMLTMSFYYLCWCVMIWSTCKMLKNKHDFVDFRIWSGLFLSYGDHNIEAEISENRFLKNNMQPYLYFSCAFIGNLMVYPLISSDWLPHSELTIIGGIFSLVSMMAFMYSSSTNFPDWIVLISFAVNVLAKYPYEMDEVVTTGWRFLDLKVPTFCSFVIGNGIEFCLNCRTALYLLIPIFLIHLAKRSNWRGIYTHLLPHCITLCWLQLCITSARSATMFEMVRATLGLAGILLFLPLFGLVSLLIPVFVVIEWLGFTDPNIRLGSTVIVTLLTILGSCFLAINRTTQKYVTLLQIFICMMAACILTFPYMTSNFKDATHFSFRTSNLRDENDISASLSVDDSPIHILSSSVENLSWQKFYTYCGPPAWKNNNKIKTQLKCAHLNGVAIAWEGEVAQVQIHNIRNEFAYYIYKYLPNWLANIIACYYGNRIESSLDCTVAADADCHDFRRHILETILTPHKCSLNNWNKYEYEIRLKMSTGLLSRELDVRLQASDLFGNYSQQLVQGDRIHFYGFLSSSPLMATATLGQNDKYPLGSTVVHIRLAAIECLQCHNLDNTPVISNTIILNSPVDARIRDLRHGIKFLLNVLLSPLITFK